MELPFLLQIVPRLPSILKHDCSSTANSLQRPKFCGPSCGENALGEADRKEGESRDQATGQAPGQISSLDAADMGKSYRLSRLKFCKVLLTALPPTGLYQKINQNKGVKFTFIPITVIVLMIASCNFFVLTLLLKTNSLFLCTFCCAEQYTKERQHTPPFFS